MASEQANNQGENWSSNEGDRAVEQAFLQLGRVLAEIADNSDQQRDEKLLHEKSEGATGDSQDKEWHT